MIEGPVEGMKQVDLARHHKGVFQGACKIRGMHPFDMRTLHALLALPPGAGSHR
jgi:hypothetical protein